MIVKRFQIKLKFYYYQVKKASTCLVQSELFKSLSSAKECQSPGKDGSTKELQKHFWNVIKDPFLILLKKQGRREC